MTLHEELLTPLLTKALKAEASDLILTAESKPQIMVVGKDGSEYHEVEDSEVLTGEVFNDTVRSIRSVDRADTGYYYHEGNKFRYALTPGAILFRFIPESTEQLDMDEAELSKLGNVMKAKYPTGLNVQTNDGLKSLGEALRQEGL